MGLLPAREDDALMSMLTRKGKPKKSELPSTIARSGKKARRTFAKAHASAVDEYGEGERAMRTAYAARKHTHEKVGDTANRRKSAAARS